MLGFAVAALVALPGGLPVEETVAAGPARIVATVRTPETRWRLAGRWDPTDGYRLCAVVRRAPLRYMVRRVVWLEGRDWEYGTLTGRDPRCRAGRSWLDDHPPTLELFDVNPRVLGDKTGAEDYLHAALLFLSDAGGRAALPIDFRAFDRDPGVRDEDGWTLRPLLRRLGRRPAEVEIGRDGLIRRLRFTVPALSKEEPEAVTVGLRLYRHGDARAIPHVEATGIE